MARKRFVFQRANSTFLRIIVGILVALLVATPVFSQALRLEEAEILYRNGDFPEAILRLEEAVTVFQQQGDGRKEAIALTNLGNARLAVGQPEKAAANLGRAIELYRQLGDEAGVKRGQIYRVRSLQELGLFLQACETLTQPLGLDAGICQEENLPDEDLAELLTTQTHAIEVEGWRSLGEVFRVLGQLDESKTVLKRLTEIVPDDSAVLLSLGNTLRAEGDLERDRAALPRYDYQPWQCGTSNPGASGLRAALDTYENALEPYQKAATLTEVKIKTQAQLNRLSLLLEMAEEEEDRVEEARSLLSQIDLSPLPASRQKVYAEINLAKSRACLMQFEQNSRPLQNTTFAPCSVWAESEFLEMSSVGDHSESLIRAMNEAITEARALGDKRAESYGLGELGGLYECLGNVARSRQLTEQALYRAQPQEAPDIAYQWQWQLGRLFAEQGKREDAIAAYKSAVETLKLAREDLLALKTDVQYSFRDRIEPMYRQYLDLLLQPEASNDNLETATKMVGELQLAELENFLRCRITNLVSIDKVEQPPAAIIYPVLLKDRLEVIVKVPELKSIQHHRQDIPPQNANDVLFKLSGELAKKANDTSTQILPSAQQLYDWFIRPIENLPDDGTLVFILESVFQQVPMAILHDRDRYLVEKYSIATNLGSLLPDLKVLEPGQWETLIAGINKKAESFKREGLPELFHVAQEVKNIAEAVPSFRLENEAFTRVALREEVKVKPFSVLHISTHGTFDSNPKKTRIYAWDDTINVDELGVLLRNKIDPIELLVLSACETANGDRRAPLGIAGVALRANTKSTVASLWKVMDGTTANLMEQFYKKLNQPNTSKAEALRQAQLNFIQNENYKHPYYWSAFILAGNWL
jgi:CHAT domain-containing protein